MKISVKILNLKSIDELPNAWSNQDYIKLLGEFGLPDAQDSKPEELFELFSMAVSDFTPEEAAEKVLTYRLSDKLNEGQISQIANDMPLDKISEEYPEIDLHSELYNVNQLLFKAFNGKFPNTTATILTLEATTDEELTKEIVLKAIAGGLSDSALIKRLFTEQIAGNEEWESAKDIIWEMKVQENQIEVITSEYWLSKDDFESAEYEAEINIYTPEEDED